MLKKIKDIMSKKDKNTSEQETPEGLEINLEDIVSQVEEGIDQAETSDEEALDPMVEKDQEIGELKDKYIRLLAEFDNYKRRTIKEKMELMDTAAKSTISALLPILDDFARAKANAEIENSNEPFSEGVQLVYNKLHTTLEQRGLVAMESNGTDFDPEYHEAITEIPAPTEEMKGKVIDTVETGYTLKDKIIRYAKVVVGK
ncbi:MAG: molecular chaperone GrpE [Polaribacter sp.]|jgi:molecular chaperone GrpE